MLRTIGTLGVSLGCLVLLGSCFLARPGSAGTESVPMANGRTAPTDSVPVQPVQSVAADPVTLPQPVPLAPHRALEQGVLIVVSIPSQRLFVFRDGAVWGSSPVSTGRPGHDTPAGVFLILQKEVHHRSTLYHSAPMPYMQRLTWGGVAFHAGRLPGYPASHGCIRLPAAFARSLYAVTNLASTAVLVIDQPLGSAEQARQVASGQGLAPTLADRARPSSAQPPTAVRTGATQTIQLAAASSARNAAAFWQQLLQRQPELQQLDHQIIPATVHSVAVFRLRASGPEAHSLCTRLLTAGVACLRVNG